jgi:2-polyprenyl-3-methyl-5-hydroxy-6-metoxy-1,4-benzoquinol methylase
LTASDTDLVAANREFWSTAIQDNILEYPDEAVIRFVAAGGKDIALNRGKTAIDIGCGSGRHSILLARYGYDVTGLDLSDDALDVARAMFERAGLQARWLSSPFAEADLEAGSFDTVLGYGVLFLQGRTACLSDLKRAFELLKPGGRMLMSFRHPDSWFSVHTEDLGDGLRRVTAAAGLYEGGMYMFMDSQASAALVEEAGFVIENAERLEQWRDNRSRRHVWETYWLRRPG